MTKLKLLFAACTLLAGGLTANAQTDVTSTYLTNADFSQTTALDNGLCGYGKDMSGKETTYYGLQAIDGWTSEVLSGDNSNATYPNSGMGGAVFAYGSDQLMMGNNTKAPSADPDGNSGNCLGFFGVWGCGGYYYQEVTLAAGKYTINIPVYSQSGTQANTSYIGWIPNSGTSYTLATNPTVGSWTTLTTTFTLTDATTGKICLGYKSTGSGSGANAMLYFDKVQILYTAVVVKDVLSTAITAATNANATLNSNDLTTAIATAQAVYDDANATQDEVNNAAATLNAATELAMSAAGDVTGVFLTNPGFESCTVTETNAAAGGSAAPVNIEGGWTQISSAAWSSSAVVAYGGEGQVNGASAPSADNAGNSGNTLGVSVGWGGLVTYQSEALTLPAGVYTLQVYGNNQLSGVTQFTSKFGFVPTSGTSTLSTKTAFAYGEWEADKVTFTLNEATEGKIQIGGQAISGGSGSNAKVFFDNITISYQSFLAGAKTAWDEAVADAEAAKTECPNVTGEELTALNAELAKAEPTTVAGYNDAEEAIEAATATLRAAKANYDALVAEIAYAKTIGIAAETADSYAATSESTAATALTSAQNLKVLEYSTINAAYGNEVTSLLGEWSKGSYDTTSGQGYVGNETYFDKWSGSATDLTSSATVTLPAGKYVVKVAGRGVSTTTMNLSVKVGDAEAISTPFLMNGDTGKGIDTDAATNFSEEGTYSNNNIGRGWQYRYITFEADGTSEITIAVNGHLNNGTWQSFYAPVLLCDDATYATVQLIAAKAELQAAIDAAPAVMTVNIGTGAFQFAEAGVNTYAAALTAAKAAHGDAEATVSSIETAKTTLATAIETYNALEMNAPEATQAYNLVFNCEGHTSTGYALTLIPNTRTDQGLYGLKYLAPANTNLAQAFYFTHTTGNKYKLAAIDQDGETRYITTQAEGYETTWYDGIRTVTDAEKAMEIEIRPNGEGLFILWNTGANKAIAHNGNNNNDMYTNNTANFQFVETAKPSITINTSAAGWGTAILPFAVASLPTDVKAYTCAEVSEGSLTLAEVTALEANKPYIIEGSWNETLTGDAKGASLTYTEGLLTGVYTGTEVPAGSYVMQKKGETVGFYKVAEGAQPTAKANRAYLTVSSSTRSSFILGDNETTGLESIDALMSGKATIFDANGMKKDGLQKGVNIIKMNDGSIRKVVVK